MATKILGTKSRKRKEESETAKSASVQQPTNKQESTFDQNAHNYILAFEDRIKNKMSESSFDKSNSVEFLQKLKDARDKVMRQLNEGMEKEGIPSDSLGIEDSAFTAYMEQVKIHQFVEQNTTQDIDQYLTSAALSSSGKKQRKDLPNVHAFDTGKEGDTAEQKLLLEKEYERDFKYSEEDDTKESLNDSIISIDLSGGKVEKYAFAVTQKSIEYREESHDRTDLPNLVLSSRESNPSSAEAIKSTLQQPTKSPNANIQQIKSWEVENKSVSNSIPESFEESGDGELEESDTSSSSETDDSTASGTESEEEESSIDEIEGTSRMLPAEVRMTHQKVVKV